MGKFFKFLGKLILVAYICRIVVAPTMRLIEREKFIKKQEKKRKIRSASSF